MVRQIDHVMLRSLITGDRAMDGSQAALVRALLSAGAPSK